MLPAWTAIGFLSLLSLQPPTQPFGAGHIEVVDAVAGKKRPFRFIRRDRATKLGLNERVALLLGTRPFSGGMGLIRGRLPGVAFFGFVAHGLPQRHFGGVQQAQVAVPDLGIAEVHAQEHDLGIVLAAIVPGLDEIAPELVEAFLAGFARQRAIETGEEFVTLALEGRGGAAELGEIALVWVKNQIELLASCRAAGSSGPRLRSDRRAGGRGRANGERLPELGLEFVGIALRVSSGTLIACYPDNG